MWSFVSEEEARMQCVRHLVISGKHPNLNKTMAHRIVRGLTVEYKAEAKPSDYQMSEETARTPRTYDQWIVRSRSRSPAPQR